MLQKVLRLAWVLLLFACAVESHPAPDGPQRPVSPVDFELAGVPFERLSEYGLFAPLPEQSPVAGVVPYDLTTPLFSDYAFKERFLWLPAATTATYRDTGALAFPVGTVLVKTFYYPEDMREPAGSRRVLETRLLIHTPDGWIAAPYLWDEDGKDARLVEEGAVVDVTWIDDRGRAQSLAYEVPDHLTCAGCHKIDGEFLPIGPSARFLNRSFAYGQGEENQLAWLQRHGYLDLLPPLDEVPSAADWNDTGADLEARATAYLDINCAHCHQPRGVARHVGLDFRSGEFEPERYGICGFPLQPVLDPEVYVIAPGNSEKSLLLQRLASTEPGVRMPELGRQMQHEEAVALIRTWIESLDHECDD